MNRATVSRIRAMVGEWTDDARRLVVFPQDSYPKNAGRHDYTRAVLNAPSAPVLPLRRRALVGGFASSQPRPFGPRRCAGPSCVSRLSATDTTEHAGD